MKVIVCGGRHGWKGVESELDKAHRIYDLSVIIQGGARGVDNQALKWGRENGVTVETYPAEWDAYGRSAGARRNGKMLKQGRPEMVIAFPGGAGTGDMVLKALKSKVPVIQVTDSGWTVA